MARHLRQASARGRGRAGALSPQGGQTQRVAHAKAASEVIAVVTTVTVAPDTRAKTTANRMKSLRMMIPHFHCTLYARRSRRDL